jgi:cation diffusion facilitator family transporter
VTDTRDGGGGERLTVWVAFAVNASIAVLKGFAGALTGSSATLAEAAHSVADTANQGLLRLSLSLAERPPDEEHPFGYGKERFLWSLIASLFIFAAGAIFSFARGLYSIVAGRSGGKEMFWLLYAVLGYALVAETISWIRALRQTLPEARRRGRGLVAFSRQSDDPTTKTVLYEDSAAVVGVLLALAGVGLHQLTGDPLPDDIAAMVDGVLLMTVGVALFRDTKGLVIGEAAPEDERSRIREIIGQHDEVVDVLDLRTMYLGPGSLMVAVRLDLRDDVDAGTIEQLSETIDRELREAVASVDQVFLDATPRRPRAQPAMI